MVAASRQAQEDGLLSTEALDELMPDQSSPNAETATFEELGNSAVKIEELGDSAVVEIEELDDSAVVEIEELPPSEATVAAIGALGDSAVVEIEELDDSAVVEIEELPPSEATVAAIEALGDSAVVGTGDSIHAIAVAADPEISDFTSAESTEVPAEQLSFSQEMVFREEIAILSAPTEKTETTAALNDDLLIPLPPEPATVDSSHPHQEDNDQNSLLPATQRREKTSVLPDMSERRTGRQLSSSAEAVNQEAHRQIARLNSQADEYLRQKRFPEAIGIWSELLALQPDSSIEDQIVIAEQHLQKARQLWEDSTLLADSDKIEDARILVEQCLEIYPHHGSAQQLLLDLQRRMRQQDQRLQHIFQEGQELIFAKDFAAARSLWQKAGTNLAPGSPQLEQWREQTNRALHQAMLQQVQKHLHHKKLDQAIVMLDQATEFFPLSTEFQQLWQQTTATKRHSQELLRQAEQAAASEEFSAALAAIEQVLAVDADNQKADAQKQEVQRRLAS